jgi:hypothetical protein
MKRFRLPSPAMVVALGALVMSVGGNVTAAALITSAGIQDNTIRTVDVRDGTLKSVDVTNGTLTGADVKDATLQGADVANNSLTGADVKESSLGQVPSAGKVDGLDANSIIRVARMSTSSSMVLTLSPQTFGTPLSITAPKAGFVIINGHVSFGNSGSTTGYLAGAQVRHIQSGVLSTMVLAPMPPPLTVASTSHAWVFPVSAGVNTFDLRVSRGGGNGILGAAGGELTAIYAPFGPTGAGTL